MYEQLSNLDQGHQQFFSSCTAHAPTLLTALPSDSSGGSGSIVDNSQIPNIKQTLAFNVMLESLHELGSALVSLVEGGRELVLMHAIAHL